MNSLIPPSSHAPSAGAGTRTADAAPGLPAAPRTHAAARTRLPGNSLAPGAARRFIRATLAGWAGPGPPAPGEVPEFSDRFVDDAAVLVSELVTNAVVHAGTAVELLCRLGPGDGPGPAALVIEVSDQHPSRTVRSEPRCARDERAEYEYGRGLHVVAALAECWGITYRTGRKTVWARLAVHGDEQPGPNRAPCADVLQRGLRAAEILAPNPHRGPRQPEPDWVDRGALTFLAEASDLLAGQFDEDMIAALAGQLMVPRFADWCAIWLDADAGPAAAPRLARVWHARESALEVLRATVEKEPPRLPASVGTGPVPVPWPRMAGQPHDGAALAYRLVAGGRGVGVLLLGRAGLIRMPDEVTGLIEDFARRVGLAIGAARQYTRQATISRVLQRGLLPSRVAEIPGVDSALVYQPSNGGVAGGDFYDVFPGAGGRWCFALGDVQGSGPEAAVLTGLARPWLRLLAREGYAVHEVLDRLNQLLVDNTTDATEAAEAAIRLAAVESAAPAEPPDGPQTRFLSLLYGELVPDAEGRGVRCTLVSAGHPLPLLLRPDGSVRPAAAPQMLLGVVEGARYESETFRMTSGDTLLCVTDGITERRSGPRLLDDGDGLAAVLARCTGLTASGVAARIKQAVYAFAEAPPADDLALLVLRAR